MLQLVAALHLIEPLLLLQPLAVFALQGLAQPLLQSAAASLEAARQQHRPVMGRQGAVDHQGGGGGCRLGIPAAVNAGAAAAEAELFIAEGRQPGLPALPELLPGGLVQRVHRCGQQRLGGMAFLPRQLQRQGRADALIGAGQGAAQRKRQQAELAAPVGEGFVAGGWAACQRRRWAVAIAGADRPQPRLLIAHLAGGRHYTAVCIEQEQIAAAPHQLHHQAALNRLTGALGELQLHHPLPARLLQPHQGQAAEAVLQLLGQGAALTTAGGWLDRQQPRRLSQPAQLEPGATLQAAESQLQGVGIGLACLLEAAGQQLRPQLPEHRLQAGEVHRLEGQRSHGGGIGCGGAPTLQGRARSRDGSGGLLRRQAVPDHRSEWCRQGHPRGGPAAAASADLALDLGHHPRSPQR